MIWNATLEDIMRLKQRLNIRSSVSISWTTYEQTTNKVLAKGRTKQSMCGTEIKHEIDTLLTGSYGKTVLRIIYDDNNEPTILRKIYEHTKIQATGSGDQN